MKPTKRFTPRWYSVTTSYLPVLYVYTTPARVRDEHAYALIKPVKLPPRQWLEREVAVAKDTILRAQQRVTLIEDTLASLPPLPS
jgi:hypothetical protein